MVTYRQQACERGCLILTEAPLSRAITLTMARRAFAGYHRARESQTMRLPTGGTA